MSDDRAARRAADAQTLQTRIQDYIRHHLRDPRLTAASIALAHSISRRQLYKVFSAASRPTVPVGVVAHRCGFVDPTHFSRVFHHKYGLTPRQLRKALIEPSPTPPGTVDQN